jgi:hypothetical protein
MRLTTHLYRVRRPNLGLYFGIFDPATHRIRTERTEQAAAAVAAEMGLQLEGEQEVTHEQWLRLTGIVTEDEISAEQAAHDSIVSIGQPPKPSAAPPPAGPVQHANFSNEPDDTLLIQRQFQPSAFFATESLRAEHDLPGTPKDA